MCPRWGQRFQVVGLANIIWPRWGHLDYLNFFDLLDNLDEMIKSKYFSEMIFEGVEISKFIQSSLYDSSDAKDIDFTINHNYVYPDC